MMNKLPSTDEVIVFRKRKEPAFGILKEKVAERVSVISEDGKDLVLEAGKIILATGIKFENGLNQAEKKLRLRSIRKELDRKKDSIDLRTLWECVYSSEDVLTLRQFIELYFGENEIENEDILLLVWAIEKDDIYFVTHDGGYRPRSSREVEDSIIRKEKENRKQKERNEIIRWARQVIQGVKETSARNGIAERYLDLLKGYVIYLDRFQRAHEAKSFMSEIGLKSIEDAVEFLIKAGTWKVDEDPLIKRLGLTVNFPKNVTDEAINIIQGITDDSGFEDLTGLETYSIDDKNSLDIDDALSICKLPEGFMVGVHISNVACYIPKWSLLDDEAKNRGETIYLPEYNIHMFPPDLISNVLSLIEGTPKLAISLLATFDNNFKIINSKFIKSKIVVKNNLSYNGAEEFLSKTDLGSKMIEIAFELRKKRVDRGAFILELPDLKIKVNEKGEIGIKKYYMNTVPHIVVTEFMILMNCMAGKLLRENAIPSLYRSQPETISDEAWKLDHKNPLFPIMAVKYLKPSRIGLSPEPHLALGLDVYVQITSPIRRYLDLVLQRQLLSYLDGYGFLYTEDELESIYHLVEMGIREKKIVEKSREKYWVIKQLKSHTDEGINGVISYLTDSSASVYLPDYLLEVQVPKSSEMTMNVGDIINLKVQQADPLRKKIVLIPLAR
ncbi:ribonuclease catalytic domain-containing protein [Desulfobacterota bacterium AH_259_B03_O07]|nr:ribonuclease catalytic domain-containing protein [Desulfobacterota bacterium AH_259_B03_O07]